VHIVLVWSFKDKIVFCTLSIDDEVIPLSLVYATTSSSYRILAFVQKAKKELLGYSSLGYI